MSLPPSRSTIRPLLRAVRCAVTLGAALCTAGSIAAAKPKPKPKSHASKSASTSSRSAKRGSAARDDAAATLPTVPSVVELPSMEIGLQGVAGGTTPAQAFAAMPSVPSPTETRPAGPLSAFSASAERLLSAMMDRARSQLGTRYVYGGNKPGSGLDCSSFARFAMEALGIQLPRTAAQQARVGTAVPRDKKLLRPGDLLTFGRGSRVSHVGIYLGEGRFIHASVSSGQIIETTIDRNARLFRRWQGARRLIAGAGPDSAALGAF